MKPKVLVIDDVHDAAATLAAMVGMNGYETSFVTDPRVAVARCLEFRPRIVLLDIGMPHINGYQLAPKLRSAMAPGQLGIFAVTAWGSALDKEHSRNAGFDEHLVKPVNAAALMNTIARYTDNGAGAAN